MFNLELMSSESVHPSIALRTLSNLGDKMGENTTLS